MRLKVIRLLQDDKNDLVCEDENGERHNVDFFTGGEFPKNVEPASLIGRTIEVDYLYPYLEFASAPRVVG